MTASHTYSRLSTSANSLRLFPILFTDPHPSPPVHISLHASPPVFSPLSTIPHRACWFAAIHSPRCFRSLLTVSNHSATLYGDNFFSLQLNANFIRLILIFFRHSSVFQELSHKMLPSLQVLRQCLLGFEDLSVQCVSFTMSWSSSDTFRHHITASAHILTYTEPLV